MIPFANQCMCTRRPSGGGSQACTCPSCANTNSGSDSWGNDELDEMSLERGRMPARAKPRVRWGFGRVLRRCPPGLKRLPDGRCKRLRRDGALDRSQVPDPLLRVIKLNRRYGIELGWKQRLSQILILLGLAPDVNERDFAQAVARWQSSRGIQPTHGVLGPITWDAMKKAIDPATPAPASTPGKMARASRGIQACATPTDLNSAEQTAVAITTNFETGRPFGCGVSPTGDPDAISIGMLQWNLRAGTLQPLLRSFEGRGGSLERHFGPLAPTLRSILSMPYSTRAERDVTVERSRRVRQSSPEAWFTALRNLCVDPIFCGLQVEDMRGRLNAAWRATRELELRTVRGLSMMFDINVGDGYAAKFNGRMVANRKIALFKERILGRERSLGRRLTEAERLVEIAEEAARYAGRWAEERRARRRVIALGSGMFRRQNWTLDAQFPGLNDPLA
jgi:hypothetical protein